MDCGHSEARMKLYVDRLSMLPDDLIHKILSFNSSKDAVQTSALSSRWRLLWTSMPYLNISTDDFGTRLRKLSEFVKRLLAGRNGRIEVYSVKLSFDRTFCEVLLKQILDYAFSHNVQQLTISTWLVMEKIDFPLYLFLSSSLKCLRLTGCDVFFPRPRSYSIVLASALELPALTTLHLDYVVFDDNLFSKCANLKNLTLHHFAPLKSRSFTIFHPQLSTLTLEDGVWNLEAVNVVAPRLENLTIKNCYGKHLITAPNLAFLLFKDRSSSRSRLLQFDTDLPSLGKVDLCIYSHMSSGCEIPNLFQLLRNVKFLTVNLEFFEPLISYMEQISQPSPFSNLNGLTIYPVDIPSDEEAHKKVHMTPKVINYLRNGSPGATFTLISYEEIKENQQKALAISNAARARNLMADLQVTLEKEKSNFETSRTRMTPMKSHEESDTDEEENNTDDQGKAPVRRMQLDFKRKLKQMKRFSEDVGVRIDQGKRDTRYIISQLCDIEVLLMKDLPTSKRDELQACFSSLCAEVDTFVKKIVHHMMIPQNHLNDCFDKLATTSLPSS